MKRSMTVIQEEDFEESALATSHLNFNSHLGGGHPNLANSSPRARIKQSNQQFMGNLSGSNLGYNQNNSHLSKSGQYSMTAKAPFNAYASEMQ